MCCAVILNRGRVLSRLELFDRPARHRKLDRALLDICQRIPEVMKDKNQLSSVGRNCSPKSWHYAAKSYQ